MRASILHTIVAAVLLLCVASCRKCTYRRGGATEADRIEDMMDETPECQEVRRKNESCSSGIFDVKRECGPKEGECVASAQARLKCMLSVPGNYDCDRSGNMKSMAVRTPPECVVQKGLCTGKDRATTILDAGTSK